LWTLWKEVEVINSIKIFTDNNVEEVVNQWLSEHKELKLVTITSSEENDTYNNGEICGQWIQTILILEHPKKDSLFNGKETW